MSYHTKLLSILIFILLYSDYITFWLASSVSPLVLETGLEYGSSSELKGFNHTVDLYSPISRVNCVRPTLGAACIRDAADQWGAVDLWAAYQPVTFLSLTSGVSCVGPISGAASMCESTNQWVMLDWLWAIYKPVTIHTDPSVCCFAPQNWTILVNGSFREFTIIERVISPAQLRAMSSIDVQVILPTRFWVNMFAALLGVNDGVISPAQVRAMLPVDVQVMLPTRFWVNMFVTLPGVNDGVISPAQVQAMLPVDVQVMLPTRFRVNMFATLPGVNDGVISLALIQAMLPVDVQGVFTCSGSGYVAH
ncbi:hypothetical protein PILCRDRAFT_11272 [Piloderma croceum F 1598]|uniref:Uncharacterized protein n=1 Tax=Piloderma croceum (strain F 1598) TaxID=765440 RepID=A0A0C3FEA7_PILCF|nr:hypothetical protein PILCRDRAFT_11272 [Piloderma croceum F 1598]